MPASPRSSRPCPTRPRTPRRPCWWSARSPMSSRISSRGCSTRWASRRCVFCRCDARPSCRRSGRDTRILLAQPFLGDTARALEERGAQRIGAPFPLGVEGTTAWLRAAADAFGVARGSLRGSHRAGPRPRRDARSSAIARCWQGKSVFLFPDSQLEIPLARFLSRELGMRADRGRHALPASPASGRRTRRCCLPSVRLSEGQDVEQQLDRCRADAARSRGLRPRPRQPAGGRGHHDEMVDRTAVHADPGLRAGRRSRRTVRAAARAPRAAGGLSHAADALDLRRTAPCRRDARSRRRCSGLHYVLHAPQGDTYADLLFTMIERRDARPPVTYTTFQARDLGGDTAELFKTAAREAYERFQPQAMIVGASCTAELIQDDPGGLAARARICRSRSSRSNCRPIRRRRTGARRRPSISSCARCARSRASATRRARRRAAALQYARARPRSASAIATT